MLLVYNHNKEGVYMKYFKKIKGERLYLSPMCEEDYEIYTKWMNDKEVAEKLGTYHKVTTISSEKKWLENETGYSFAIVLNKTDELIGNICLMDINHASQSASLGIFIGEKENRNKGYGKEAIKLLLNYGFNTLNLNNIMLSVVSFNKYAIRTYKKIGFREIGFRRQCIYRQGKLYDELFMDILKKEFNETKDYIFTEEI